MPESSSLPWRSFDIILAEIRFSPQKQLLFFADALQLHSIGLEKRNPKRKINAHYPKLRRASEVSIGRVSQEDLDEVNVKESNCRNTNPDVADFDRGHATVDDQP